MLKLLVPVLVNCLLEGLELKEANKYARSLHEHCLQYLMVIGPQYPEASSIVSVPYVCVCYMLNAILNSIYRNSRH